MEWLETAGKGLIIILGLGLIRHWIAGMVSNTECTNSKKTILAKIKNLEEEDQRQWDIINRHGHKGLDGDNNLVIRYQ